MFAARTAAAVVSRHGAQLAEADAEALVKYLPNHVLLPQVCVYGCVGVCKCKLGWQLPCLWEGSSTI